ncbi:conserved Plasmodium protein, unknown function [Plasmodium knowlesi strain H]|uniref:Uncharacterized protein n=3 Tax=Plasmodium knowlesi TaxID=5850 RepID=A0A5K1VUH0_PLAKH|nr:conserved Plasmodium protein, unknown function [Plasmodium knowlesi strain H]OTN64903.1 Uncharacterized protein PKNOH_S120123600 [Plasmodium knowlesi]CAA9988102.1 conserved Plasmodium protein, unknown function [Plasmodium knowlesi strain H]SBO19970.1 conserved Plasmodium protein, unknown function [Plasmodium knowlesi strain H]SBO29105.1 conserved Plasmodium protein, unknown function [Plasmodium knowlesi strain H]VVS77576.1 conserved Plasmodium protein, unknown function [Plasmodium knowlesi |eukprot:XP_002259077.1 hypothetical protein, conserved in Plasmodium species [Plasmodium knowlesi strain H]
MKNVQREQEGKKNNDEVVRSSEANYDPLSGENKKWMDETWFESNRVCSNISVDYSVDKCRERVGEEIGEVFRSEGANSREDSIPDKDVHTLMGEAEGKEGEVLRKEELLFESKPRSCLKEASHSGDHLNDENGYERTGYVNVPPSGGEKIGEDNRHWKIPLEGGKTDDLLSPKGKKEVEKRFKEKKWLRKKGVDRKENTAHTMSDQKGSEKLEHLKDILHEQLKKKKQILEEKLRVRLHERSKLEEDVKNAGIELFRVNKENDFLNKKEQELSEAIRNMKNEREKQLEKQIELKQNYNKQMASLKKELNYQSDVFGKFNNSLLELNNLKRYFALVNANSRISENVLSSGRQKRQGKVRSGEKEATLKENGHEGEAPLVITESAIQKRENILNKMTHDLNEIQNDIDTKKDIERNEQRECTNLERLIKEEKEEYVKLKKGRQDMLKDLNDSISKMKLRDEAIEEMNTKLMELKSTIYDMEIQKDVLTKELTTEKEKKEKLQSELGALQKEKERSIQGKEKFQKEVHTIVQQIEEVKVGIQNERNKYIQMNDEIGKLKKDIRNEQNKIKIVKNDMNKNIDKIINMYTEEIKVNHFSLKLKNDLSKVKENITRKENEIENYKNGIIRIKIQQILESTKIENVQEKVKKLNEEFEEKHQLLTTYDLVIKKNHYLIENKQLEVDRLNEEFDKKNRKNCDDHGMPLTLNVKIEKLNKQIRDVLKQSRHLEKDWFLKQSEMIKIQNENQKMTEEMLRGRDLRLILNQKKCELQENLKNSQNVLKKINKNIMYIRLQLEKFASKNSDTLTEIEKMQDEMLKWSEKKNIKVDEYKRKKENLKNDINSLKSEKEKYQQDLLHYENRILILENKIDQKKKLQEVIKEYTENKDILLLKKNIQAKNDLIENAKKQQNILLTNIKQALNKRNELENKKEAFQKNVDNGTNVSFKIKHEISFVKKNVKEFKGKKLSLSNYLTELIHSYDQLTNQTEQEKTHLQSLNRLCDIYEGIVKIQNCEKKHRFQELLKFQNAVKNGGSLYNSKKSYETLRKSCATYRRKLVSIENKLRELDSTDEAYAKFIGILLEWLVN